MIHAKHSFLALGDDILSIALRFTFEGWFDIELSFPRQSVLTLCGVVSE